MDLTLTAVAVVIGVAFLCEYVDSTLGMGYGTTLTPLLLLAGYAPLQVVPAVLVSEFVTGITAALFHHKEGNIRLDFRRDDRLLKSRLSFLGYIPRSQDSKVIFVLSICGVIGVLVAVVCAVSISRIALNIYIGAMVLAIGVIILIWRKRPFLFSWKKLFGVGLISSFNKGISGGGYGPLVTGGQIISGRDSRSSIGSTSFAEGVVCLIGAIAYIVAKGTITWSLAIPMTIGAVASTPLAALTIKRVNADRLKLVIGIATVILGCLTLYKTFA